jgi:hypothetical protein
MSEPQSDVEQPDQSEACPLGGGGVLDAAQRVDVAAAFAAQCAGDPPGRPDTRRDQTVALGRCPSVVIGLDQIELVGGSARARSGPPR